LEDWVPKSEVCPNERTILTKKGKQKERSVTEILPQAPLGLGLFNLHRRNTLRDERFKDLRGGNGQKKRRGGRVTLKKVLLQRAGENLLSTVGVGSSRERAIVIRLGLKNSSKNKKKTSVKGERGKNRFSRGRGPLRKGDKSLENLLAIVGTTLIKKRVWLAKGKGGKAIA